METIRVFDTTLRDGEQSPGASMRPEDRLRLAQLLAAAGVDAIEAGFPIASPLIAASVAQIAREVRGTTVAALARCNDEDIDAAIAALQTAQRPRVHVFIATSALHIERKLRSTPAAVREAVARAVTRARTAVDDVEFSAEDASRSDIAYLADICAVAIDAGATTINLPDTVGYALPHEYGAMFAEIRRRVPQAATVTLSAHTHDDLGLATANALAAVAAGARQLECTVNGIGERAGNAALEELVMALRVRGDALPYRTNFRSEALTELSREVSRATRMTVQPNKAVVGANAFAHESGIHQDGFLKDRATYEIVDPAAVGARAALPLSRNSGRRALLARAAELGLEVADPAAFARAFTAFAESRSVVSDAELIAFAASQREVVRGPVAVR